MYKEAIAFLMKKVELYFASLQHLSKAGKILPTLLAWRRLNCGFDPPKPPLKRGDSRKTSHNFKLDALLLAWRRLNCGFDPPKPPLKRGASRKTSHNFKLDALLLLFAVEILLPVRAIAAGNPQTIALNRSVCPENLEATIAQMLPDLPGYANRVLRRSPVWNQSDVKIYSIAAGNPEFEPLPLGPGRSDPGSSGASRSETDRNTLPSLTPAENPQLTGEEDPQQIFITTLERQYRGTQVVEIPRYHWLFLTKTSEGWRLALIFSRIGSNRANEPIAPPEETSQSFIAEAIRLWLRDCRNRHDD